MKLIAHRGASKVCEENTFGSLVYASKLGADAVECDVQPTKDGTYVIFHDNNLSRLSGVPVCVSDITYNEMQTLLAAKGKKLLTLNELISEYRETTPILLHIKMNDPDDKFIQIINQTKVDFICGIQSIKALEAVKKIRPRERILAFMPSGNDYTEFSSNGAGIIRLWQTWMPAITPSQVHSVHNGDVWIMACKNDSLDGDTESLDFCDEMKADGVLLNDIELGIKWRASKLQ